MSETVLVATLGTEPQVITLALDALLAQGIEVARVVVVHTRDDAEPIRTSLAVLRRAFLTEQHYGDRILFVPQPLTGASGPLADITTAQEIDDAFRCMYTLLRQHKQAGHRIHLNIAGGRKTMTLFAMAAAQILFDAEDHVWHVVSSTELIRSGQLHADSSADVTLVPVPLAHWGSLRADAPSRSRTFLDTALTPAEREVAELLAREGLSNAALADRLSKSPSTVANQLSSIYDKLAEFFDIPDSVDRAMFLVLVGRAF